MKRTILGIIALTFAISACTQTPAPVAFKGNEYYGKGTNFAARMGGNRDENYNSEFTPTFGEVRSEAPASLSSVGVSELPPLTASSGSIIASKPAPLKPQNFSAPPQAFNAGGMLQAPIARGYIPSVNRNIQKDSISAMTTSPMTQTTSAQSNNVQFIWPADGKIVSGFGPKKSGLYNDGINIAAPEGEPIWSAADGTVIYSGNELKGYGNVALVRHANGWVTAYAHASDLVVNKGDKVKQGQLIGYIGKTGDVDSTQLHFSIRDGKNPVNPQDYLSKDVALVQ